MAMRDTPVNPRGKETVAPCTESRRMRSPYHYVGNNSNAPLNVELVSSKNESWALIAKLFGRLP